MKFYGHPKENDGVGGDNGGVAGLQDAINNEDDQWINDAIVNNSFTELAEEKQELSEELLGFLKNDDGLIR